MKKILSILFGCLISNSCTTIQIPNTGYQERYTVTYEINDPNGKPIPKNNACPKFVLPSLETTPKIPYIEPKCEADRKCVEDVLLKHIDALRVVLSANRVIMLEAKRIYDSCEIK